MNRRRQTIFLILLTAATLMPAYSLQGWLASGHLATELPTAFFIWETTSWSLRALIEAGAILFLFQTQSQGNERVLLFFKVALIALITLTLGPVVASTGLHQGMSELPPVAYWLWSFAVASYAPLMLGAVGVAYRLQPDDIAQQETQLPVIEDVLPVAHPVVSKPEPLQLETQLEPAWKKMDTSEKLAFITSMRQQDKSLEDIASELGCHKATVSRFLKNGSA